MTAAIRELVKRSVERQGLALAVTEPTALARIAELLTQRNAARSKAVLREVNGASHPTPTAAA